MKPKYGQKFPILNLQHLRAIPLGSTRYPSNFVKINAFTNYTIFIGNVNACHNITSKEDTDMQISKLLFLLHHDVLLYLVLYFY